MTDTLLTYDGITQPITDWALDYGIYPNVITDRLASGWTTERAITTPMIVVPDQKLSVEHLPDLARYGCKRSRQSPRPSQTKQGKQAKRLTYQGQCLTTKEWGALLGVSMATINKRIRQGMPIEAVLSGPLKPGRPGVVKDFAPSLGTGAGCTTQDFPEIEFSQ